MAQPDTAQLYLATPRAFDLGVFGDQLARVLDSAPVACLRLSLAGADETALVRAADQLREIAHQRDVPIVIDDHYRMALAHGLDGVHLSTGSTALREARKALGNDAIVGCFCGASRHAGMTAAEIGADYVSFGPMADSGLTGDGKTAPLDLFQWWSEMIEVPIVAEGNLDDDLLTALAPITDFVTLGDEIWSCDDPVARLHAMLARLT